MKFEPDTELAGNRSRLQTMATHVPALNAKLRRLIEQGFYEDLSAIAEIFEVSVKTLRNWEAGANTEKPNHLPDRHIPTFMRIVQNALIEHSLGGEAEFLAFAPLEVFEVAFLARTKRPLADILLERGSADGLELIPVRKDSPRGGLIETDLHDQPDADFTVEKNEWFRLELDGLRFRHFTALQFDTRQWAKLPFLEDRAARKVHLPGKKKSGQFASMKLDATTSTLIVAILQHRMPLPSALQTVMDSGGVFDAIVNGALSGWIEETPDSDLVIHCATIETRPI